MAIPCTLPAPSIPSFQDVMACAESSAGNPPWLRINWMLGWERTTAAAAYASCSGIEPVKNEIWAAGNRFRVQSPLSTATLNKSRTLLPWGCASFRYWALPAEICTTLQKHYGIDSERELDMSNVLIVSCFWSHWQLEQAFSLTSAVVNDDSLTPSPFNFALGEALINIGANKFRPNWTARGSKSVD